MAASDSTNWLSDNGAVLGRAPGTILAPTQAGTGHLGPRGGAYGAQYIEGERYCPGMPTALKTASQDHAQNKIDEPTFRVRIEERVPFALKVKEHEDDQGRIVLACQPEALARH